MKKQNQISIFDIRRVIHNDSLNNEDMIEKSLLRIKRHRGKKQIIFSIITISFASALIFCCLLLGIAQVRGNQTIVSLQLPFPEYMKQDGMLAGNVLFGIIVLVLTGFILYLLGCSLIKSNLRKFGLFRIIGATNIQIRKILFIKTGVLCGAGLLPGLIIGNLLGYCLAPEIWHLGDAIDGSFVTCFLIFVTALLSMYKPIKIAEDAPLLSTLE